MTGGQLSSPGVWIASPKACSDCEVTLGKGPLQHAGRSLPVGDLACSPDQWRATRIRKMAYSYGPREPATPLTTTMHAIGYNNIVGSSDWTYPGRVAKPLVGASVMTRLLGSLASGAYNRESMSLVVGTYVGGN